MGLQIWLHLVVWRSRLVQYRGCFAASIRLPSIRGDQSFSSCPSIGFQLIWRMGKGNSPPHKYWMPSQCTDKQTDKHRNNQICIFLFILYISLVPKMFYTTHKTPLYLLGSMHFQPAFQLIWRIVKGNSSYHLDLMRVRSTLYRQTNRQPDMSAY